MKLTIKNLGAVGAGTIDLSKRINLFCGPNGTGKTYVSYAIYALLCRRIIFNENADYIEELVTNKAVSFEICKDKISKYRTCLLNEFNTNLDEAYGIGQKEVKNLFSKMSVEYGESDDDFYDDITNRSVDFNVMVQGVNIRIKKEKNNKSVTLTILDETIPEEAIPAMKLLMNSVVCHILVLSPIQHLRMLPVERNSIFTFSKELSLTRQMTIDHLHALSEKDKEVKVWDIINKNNNRYPLPISHSISEANDLGHIKKQVSPFLSFAEQLENELLHGKVEITENGDIRYRPDRLNSKTLPIVASASIVKTMSSLVIYLKHIAQKEDLIIIDEPEINLHPDNQIVFTRIFAHMANMGFRFIISTHSDYVIREINNLIMMSHKENETVKRLLGHEYGKDEFIKPEDIAVNDFGFKRNTSKKATITQIPVDRRGFDVEGINEIIEKQNKISETLFYGLEDD